MPTPPDHLDPKEAIEARLCAYLEGELPPQERIEIEKHLKANPQHRQLLNDLAQTRNWMRSIPRESAPPELAEAFVAHMERSMLLDYKADTGPSTISRLPQYGLLAAIVVIALGLGVLITVILRGGRNPYTLGPTTPPNASTRSNPPTTPSVPDDLTSPAPKIAARSFEKPTIAPDSPSPPLPVATAATAPPVEGAAPPAARQAIQAAPAAPLEARADLAELETVLRDRKPAGNRRTIGLLVSTSTPAATAEQVRRFFATHQIVFDDQNPAGPFPDLATAVTANNANKVAQDMTGGFGGGAQNSKIQPGAQENQLQTRDASNDNFVANNGFPQRRSAVTASPPATLPSPLSNKIEDAGEIVYVGRGLTTLQLELLHGTLATGGIDQTVKRLDLSQPPVPLPSKAALPPPTGSMISGGQALTITVPQLIAPGVERTNIVRVADDGTINLPMLDPIPAAGLSPAELQDRIATKYHEANLIPAATVTVTVSSPATRPTTQPAALEAATPATVPASPPPAAIAKASTQSIGDDRVDVVVYVKKLK